MSNIKIDSETVEKPKSWDFVGCKSVILLKAKMGKIFKNDFFDSLSSYRESAFFYPIWYPINEIDFG